MTLAWPSLILAIVASILVLAVFIIYRKGEQLRKASKFAQQLGSGEDPFKKDMVSIMRTNTRGSVARIRAPSSGTANGTSEKVGNTVSPFPTMDHDEAAIDSPSATHLQAPIVPRKKGHALTRGQQDLKLHEAIGSRSYTPRSSQPSTRETSPVRLAGTTTDTGASLESKAAQDMPHSQAQSRLQQAESLKHAASLQQELSRVHEEGV